MKRLSLLLAALLACAALTVSALAAAPELVVDGDGRPSVSTQTGVKPYLAAYRPDTGRFLGMASVGTPLTRNTALKAMLTDESFAPLGAARSVLALTEPGSGVAGGSYDAAVVTRAVGNGAVTLSGVSAAEGVTVWGGSSLTLDNCAISRVTVNVPSLAITTSGSTGSLFLFSALAATPTVTVNGVAAPITVSSSYVYAVKPPVLGTRVLDGIQCYEFQAIYNGSLVTVVIRESARREVSSTIANMIGTYPDAYGRPALVEVAMDQNMHAIAARPVRSETDDPGPDGGVLYGQNSHNRTEVQGRANPIKSSKYLWETFNTGDPGLPIVSLQYTNNKLYTVENAVFSDEPDEEGALIGGWYDYGLGAGSKASVFLIQPQKDVDGNLQQTIKQIGELRSALGFLSDADPNTPGTQFRGVVSAALGNDGKAKWIVIKSTTPHDFKEIIVTSESGSAGAPKAGELLQVAVPKTNPATGAAVSDYVKVSTIVNGVESSTGIVCKVTPGGKTTLNITATAGVSYKVEECKSDGGKVDSALIAYATTASDTSSAAAGITVTSATGTAGAPKDGESLQVIVPARNEISGGTTSDYVMVTTVVGGAAVSSVEYPVTEKGKACTLSIRVSASVTYQVAESSGAGVIISGGLSGTGTGVK